MDRQKIKDLRAGLKLNREQVKFADQYIQKCHKDRRKLVQLVDKYTEKLFIEMGLLRGVYEVHLEEGRYSLAHLPEARDKFWKFFTENKIRSSIVVDQRLVVSWCGNVINGYNVYLECEADPRILKRLGKKYGMTFVPAPVEDKIKELRDFEESIRNL